MKNRQGPDNDKNLKALLDEHDGSIKIVDTEIKEHINNLLQQLKHVVMASDSLIQV